MEAKEKAKQLVDIFYNEIFYFDQAKKCAIISVDEILSLGMLDTSYYNGSGFVDFESYWNEVKTEINNL